jgi:hypothetical protein
VLLLLSVAALCSWRLGRRPAPAEPPLPRELEPRIELFARAWLRGDLPRMRQLTVTTQDRVLYAWHRRHLPPAVPDEADAASPSFRVDTVADRPPYRVVRLHLAGPPPPGRSSLPLTLTWEVREGAWFFLPFPDFRPRAER